MSIPVRGAIDCDIHPAVPGIKTLLPYMDEFWQETFIARGQDGFVMGSYPPNAPISCRPDWKPPAGLPGSDFGQLQSQALDSFQARFAICNCLYGGLIAVSETMAAAMCGAVNDWIAAEWLDRDPRLRASILIPAQSPELAVEEIERLAADRRFVQILMPAALEMMLGKRYYWPIYAAAERHGLPIGLHAGSMYRHAPTSTGWPSHFLQDYVSNTQAFESQLLSLIAQGVFSKFPALKVVLIESGVTWLPGLIWRAVKTWRGVRAEVPWVKQSPAEQIREHVRLTVQPIDGPKDAGVLERIIEQIGSDDMLLFSTDYPHWQFENEAALPDGIPRRLIEKIMVENPLATYSRLKENVQ
ncbi:MAG TPA: amidohydrolase family protein [Acetobacteraceae bacterium]